MVKPLSVRHDGAGLSFADTDIPLQYLDAARLCLDGSSVLDWFRLRFTDMEEVHRFLAVNRADPDDPFDAARLRHLHREALHHIDEHYGYRVPRSVAAPDRIEDLFRLASRSGRLRRPQVLACVVLKLMHVLNQLEAHTLLQETAVSEAELGTHVERALMQAGQGMMADGVRLASFYGNRKSRDSMLTKLLVKRGATAGDILDRVRFRFVTDTRDDIVPAIAHLIQRVLPFNHVLARESVNNLVDLRAWLAAHPRLRGMATALHPSLDEVEGHSSAVNEFSGDSYRIVNFVVEVPVRLDQLRSQAGRRFTPRKGRVVYVQAEIQILDRETSFLNEQGDNSHVLYKQRQQRAADRRLKWGVLQNVRGRPEPIVPGGDDPQPRPAPDDG